MIYVLIHLSPEREVKQVMACDECAVLLHAFHADAQHGDRFVLATPLQVQTVIYKHDSAGDLILTATTEYPHQFAQPPASSPADIITWRGTGVY